jgi:hypothetical protein
MLKSSAAFVGSLLFLWQSYYPSEGRRGMLAASQDGNEGLAKNAVTPAESKTVWRYHRKLVPTPILCAVILSSRLKCPLFAGLLGQVLWLFDNF